jgi:hypothetical protein
MTHPPAHELDAAAAGERNTDVLSHLSSCEPCAAYVSKLRGQAEAFRATADPRAFADKIAERAARTTPTVRARRANVIYLVAPALAAAAAVLLWLRAPSGLAGPSSDSLHGSGTETAQPAGEAPRFKGEMVVAVIREREGRQARLMGPFTVRPFDRVRIEVGVDRSSPITAGLLSADGTWTLLLAPAALEAGTHFSELSARFDEASADAMLLVGAPEAVERARRTRNFEDVVGWHVTSDPPR